MTVSSKKITGSAGAYFDYLREAAGAFSYYKTSEDDLAFKETWGALATELGLEHGITKQQWTELFNGCWNGEKVVQAGYRKVVDPETGETVTAPANNAMVDCMFSAPKGVSEAYARAATQEEADRIADAFKRAVMVSWHETVEGYARVARVKGERVTAKMLATPVMQFTSRPIDGGLPNPHLHCHVPTFMAVKVEDRWYQMDMVGIMRTAEFRWSVLDSELARNMEALGYTMDYSTFDDSRKGRVTFEPTGSIPELRKAWSQAHEQVMKMRREFEATHGREMRREEEEQARTLNRASKDDKEMDANPDRARWQEQARELGYDAPAITPGEPVEAPENRVEILTERLMAAKGLARENATFNDDTIKPAIARCAMGLGMVTVQVLACVS